MNADQLIELAKNFGWAVVLGVFLIVALASWLGKVWASRILEKDRGKYEAEIERLRQSGASVVERLRTQGERDLFVHRLQFEKEFEIYNQLWKPMLLKLTEFSRVLMQT